MKLPRSTFLIALLFTISACENPFDIPIAIPSGEAPFQPQFPVNTAALVGFPRAKVDFSKMNAFDSTYDTTLAPGDSIKLWLVYADFPYAKIAQMKDTLRSVTWRFSPYTWGPSFGPDSSIATLRADRDGSIVISIHKPSYSLSLTATTAGKHFSLLSAYSCDQSGCVQVMLTVPVPIKQNGN